MSQQKLVDIPFFDLSIEDRKRLVFCIYFFNARVSEARKHKCEYIGKESPAYSKKRMGKEALDIFQPVFWRIMQQRRKQRSQRSLK